MQKPYQITLVVVAKGKQQSAALPQSIKKRVRWSSVPQRKDKCELGKTAGEWYLPVREVGHIFPEDLHQLIFFLPQNELALLLSNGDGWQIDVD